MDEAMPDEGNRMTREEFIKAVEQESNRMIEQSAHQDGTSLTETEKKKLKYLYKKRAEVFWTSEGAPPKGASINLILKETDEGMHSERVEVSVKDMQPMPIQGGYESPDLMFLVGIISFLSLLMVTALIIIFYIQN